MLSLDALTCPFCSRQSTRPRLTVAACHSIEVRRHRGCRHGRALAFYRKLGLDGCPLTPTINRMSRLRSAAGCELHGTPSRPSVRSIGLHASVGRTRLGLAFACDSPAEVDSVYATLTDAGYEGHLAPWIVLGAALRHRSRS